MLNTDNPFTFSQSLKFKTFFLNRLNKQKFSVLLSKYFWNYARVTHPLVPSFFEQQLKSWLAVFRNSFFTGFLAGLENSFELKTLRKCKRIISV